MNAHFHTGGYSLEIEDPRTSATTIERHVSLAAVVSRAARLIESGYVIGIWSADSLELRPADGLAANDDVWLNELSKRLTG